MAQTECQSQALAVACGVTAYPAHLNYMGPRYPAPLPGEGTYSALESTILPEQQ